MSDWSTYRLQDFIPFSADVYFRLLERMGETFWPLQLLMLVVGAAALFLALANRAQFTCLLLAPLWIFVGVTFFAQRYAELNWAGHYIGRAFLAQAAILIMIPLIGFGLAEAPHYKKLPFSPAWRSPSSA